MPEIGTPTPGLAGAGAGIVTEHQQVLDNPPSPAAQGWRERFVSLGIAIHELAERFPDPSDEELTELGRDIYENGLRHPIVFYCDRIKRNRNDYPRQHELILIDGRSRLTAMERVGINLFDERGRFNPDIGLDKYEDAVEIRWRKTSKDSNEVFDPVAYIISVNVRRRHLTAEKKRELVAELLKAKPERSDRAIGKLVDRDHKTVAKDRADLEARGEIPHVEKRTDSTGRQQPATKPKPQSVEEWRRAVRERAAAEAEARSAGARQSPERFGIADELEQVLRILRGDRSRIAQIPLAKRVALARGCLSLLDVTLDDLQPIGDGP